MGKGLLLIGDLGFGECKSGAEWWQQRQSAFAGTDIAVGTGNLSPLADTIQQQASQANT